MPGRRWSVSWDEARRKPRDRLSQRRSRHNGAIVAVVPGSGCGRWSKAHTPAPTDRQQTSAAKPSPSTNRISPGQVLAHSSNEDPPLAHTSSSRSAQATGRSTRRLLRGAQYPGLMSATASGAQPGRVAGAPARVAGAPARARQVDSARSARVPTRVRPERVPHGHRQRPEKHRMADLSSSAQVHRTGMPGGEAVESMDVVCDDLDGVRVVRT